MFSLILVGKMCFLSRPVELVTFHRKNDETQKMVVDFLLEKTHSQKVTTTTANPENRLGFCV